MYSFVHVQCQAVDPVEFVFKGLDSSLQIRSQRPALTSVEQYRQDERFVEFIIFVGKWVALFFISIASLDMAKCACASLIFTSSNDVTSLVCVDFNYQELELVHFLQIFSFIRISMGG